MPKSKSVFKSLALLLLNILGLIAFLLLVVRSKKKKR